MRSSASLTIISFVEQWVYSRAEKEKKNNIKAIIIIIILSTAHVMLLRFDSI